jgi:UDPglucose 6-dehydrogenase
VNYDAKLLTAVEAVNNAQKSVLVRKIRKHFGDRVKGLKIALWGLAFKPNTDDMRAAPSVVMIEELLSLGATVRAFDPVAMSEARRILGNTAGFTLADSAYDALQGADALAIVTEWQEFRSPDFDRIKEMLKQPVIFDGRNLYSPEVVKRMGLSYYGIGRGMS